MHPSILIELFDLSMKFHGESLEELTDTIEANGVRVDNVENFDTKIYFNFSYPTLGALNEDVDAQLSGSLVIDRMVGQFEVLMSFRIDESISESVNYMPLKTRDFEEVLRYIALVNENIDTLMFNLLPQRAYTAVFNEAVAYDAASNYRQLSDPAKEYLISLLEQYGDGMGADSFNIAGVAPEIVGELINGGYIMVRGNSGVLDRTAVDSLRSITFG